MDGWVVLANIKRFQDMLKAETDPERLSTLEALLSAEVAKIKSIEDLELAKQAWEQYMQYEGRG